MSLSIIDGFAFRNGTRLPWKRSPNVGGRLVPEYIVLHDTAGHLHGNDSIAWLCDPASKVSAHVVIQRDGTITQLVPFHVKAWHAGQSIWKNRSLLNGFSIGIEIVNPGRLVKTQDGMFKGVALLDPVRDQSLSIKYAKTNPHGEGYWLAYTPAQIQAVKELCEALCQEFQIKEVLTHWLISPGRKVDTNPLFPLEDVRAHVADLTTRVVKPVAIAAIGDTDESAGGGDDPLVKNDDYDAQHGLPDKDESEGGIGAFWRLAKSRIVQAASTIGLGSFGSLLAFLSDWRTLAVFCTFIVVCGAGFIVYRRSLAP